MCDIYDLICQAVYCEDILECGSRLSKFASEALQEKNRVSPVRDFYQRLVDGMTDYYMDGAFGMESIGPFHLEEGDRAVIKFLYLSCPKQTTPVKSLRALLEHGKRLQAELVLPIGERITTEQVKQVMSYLNDQYQFCEVVFADQRPIIMLLNCSNRFLNSECMISFYEDKTITQHFLLYHMKKQDKTTPIAVFFHELAHALLARWLFSVNHVPLELIDCLEQIGFPTIKEYNDDQQLEVAADVLSMGMMYDSPFADSDIFEEIPKDSKKSFKELFESILIACPKNKKWT